MSYQAGLWYVQVAAIRQACGTCRWQPSGRLVVRAGGSHQAGLWYVQVAAIRPACGTCRWNKPSGRPVVREGGMSHQAGLWYVQVE